MVWSCDHVCTMFDYTTHVVMHREGVQVAEVVTRLSTTLACGV